MSIMKDGMQNRDEISLSSEMSHSKHALHLLQYYNTCRAPHKSRNCRSRQKINQYSQPIIDEIVEINQTSLTHDLYVH